jgi:hypothetical protein
MIRIHSPTALYLYLSAVLCTVVHTTPAQTPAEIQALEKLGKGCVVYDHNGSIVRQDLGDDLERKVLLESADTAVRHAPLPCISTDGAYVFYRKWYPGDTCEIWRMTIDGAEPVKVSPSYPRMNWLRQSWTRPSGQEPERIVFVSGSDNDTALWNFPQIYRMDSGGDVACVLDLDSVVADFLDIAGNILTYRKNRQSVMVYDMESGLETLVVAGCSQTLSPRGDRLVVNKFGHTGFWLYEYSSKKWIQRRSVNYPMQLGCFKWANRDDWVAMVTEALQSDMAFAYNIKTDQSVRITFDQAGQIGWVNLFLRDTTVAVIPAIPATQKKSIHPDTYIGAQWLMSRWAGPLKIRVIATNGRCVAKWNGSGKFRDLSRGLSRDPVGKVSIESGLPPGPYIIEYTAGSTRVTSSCLKVER